MSKLNRREFLSGSGSAFAAAALSLPSATGAGERPENDIPSSDAGPEPNIGPYPHMWLSDDQAPYLEQIGLGLAALKVGGAGNISKPIWPAFKLLAKEKDPIRSVWSPHGLSPIEPETEPDPELELLWRRWRPHALASRFRWRSAEVEQGWLALKGGAMARLVLSGPVGRFHLDGESNGEAAVQQLPTGLAVKEMQPSARPLEYRILLEPAPVRIEVFDASDGTESGSGSRKARWRFHWNDPKEIAITAIVSDGNGMPHDSALETPSAFSRAAQKQKASWARHYNREVVRVETPDERIDRLVDYLAWVYRSNGLYRGGLLNHRFNMPKQTFYAFWCWDCCFNALSGRWYHDRELVWGNLRNMPNVQLPDNLEEGGCIPNSANYFGSVIFMSDDPMAKRIPLMPHAMGRFPGDLGDGSHPPILGQALGAVWRSEGRTDLSPGLLETAQKYHDWFERRRQSERHPGLLMVRRWSDSGMDNSKRWGHQGSGIYGTELESQGWSMPIITVDLNVYSVLEKRALAEIWEWKGEGARAATLRKEAEERARLVQTVLWNEEERYYLDRAEENDFPVPVISPTGAYPLLLDSLPARHEEGIFAKLMDPAHFFTPAPIPSLSVSDPDFKPSQSYWMGPSWMCYTAYILRGMFQRRPASAWKMFDNLLDTLVQDGAPYIFENYNPLTRQYQDCQGFHWQGLFLDLILQEILGLRIGNDGLFLEAPRTPEGWSEYAIRNAYFAGAGYDIGRFRENGAWKGTLRKRQ